MQSIVIHSPHNLRVETQPEPSPPQAGEVRVEVRRGGICGSDLHYYHHGGFGAVRLREPMVLGHEVSGVVAEPGDGVTELTAGDKVAINPSMPCGTCAFCQAGMRNQCSDMRFNGSAMRFPHQQGLFRQGVTLPAAQVIRLNPHADLGAAACAEPFAVCLHAVRQAGELGGQRVLVSGCGPIGCLTVLAVAKAGAHDIIATDLADPPLAIAQRLGATRTINLTNASLDDLAADKGRVDVVFECSGSPKALLSAFEVLKPGGLLVVVGLGADVTLPLSLAVTKEIRMIGSFRFDAEFAEAVDLIDRGVVDVSPLITATMPFADAVAAFETASDRSRSMKVQLAFGPD